jgi:hemoglobin-like flavoprotein
MDERQIEQIQECFKIVEPRADELMELFYARLFMDHPDARELFSGDLEMQKRHFLAAFSLSVEHLHRPEALRVPLQRMGTRHSDYGVSAEMYPWVRDAILWAIREIAGDRLTADTEAAWGSALDEISRVMMEGHAS